MTCRVGSRHVTEIRATEYPPKKQDNATLGSARQRAHHRATAQPAASGAGQHRTTRHVRKIQSKVR